MKFEIKRLNRQRVLKYIFSNEIVSRAQIAYDLKMSMPTVLQNVSELQNMGLVCETGQYESTGGRKAAMIACAAGAKLAAGIDITRNHISFILVDLAGNILRNQRIFKPFENMEKYYTELDQLLRQFLGKEANTSGKLLGVGVSIPGILSENTDLITDSHVLGLKDFPCEHIYRHISWPCRFMNDANAAGMAELRKMDPMSTMVYLSLSNSVGGAVFIDGNLYKGLNQRSGEFGHMKVVPGGKKCYCGQNGCLDAYCSSLVLTNQSHGELKEFFEKLAKEEKNCEKLWKDYLEKLTIAINDLRMCFDCTIVLGGYVGGWMEPWLKELQRQADEENPFGKGCDLHVCQFRYEASAFGAAMQFVDSFLEQI